MKEHVGDCAGLPDGSYFHFNGLLVSHILP